MRNVRTCWAHMQDLINIWEEETGKGRNAKIITSIAFIFALLEEKFQNWRKFLKAKKTPISGIFH